MPATWGALGEKMKRKLIIIFLLTNIVLLFAQNQNGKIVFKNELAQIIQTNDSIKISNNCFDDISRRFIKKEIELKIENIKQDENKYQYFDISGDKLYLLRSNNICWTYSENAKNPFSIMQITRVSDFKNVLEKYKKNNSEREWEYEYITNFKIKEIKASSYYVENNTTEYVSSYLQYLKKEDYENFYLYIKSPWVPGKERNSSGIGEYLEITFNEPSDNLVVLNGYVDLEKRHLYKYNNRVKTAVITSLDKEHPFEFEYTFEDYVHFSEITLPEKVGKVRLTIKDVYKGEKWDDTCIQAVITNKTE